MSINLKKITNICKLMYEIKKLKIKTKAVSNRLGGI